MTGSIQWIDRQIFLTAHPVGSYFWSNDPTNPGEIYGGTWSRIGAGRFVVAAGDDTDAAYAVGQMGGKTNIQILTKHMPKHNHTVRMHITGSGVRYLYGDTEDAGVTGQKVYSMKAESVEERENTSNMVSTTMNAGNGEAFEHVPPYIAAYCWRRTS